MLHHLTLNRHMHCSQTLVIIIENVPITENSAAIFVFIDGRNPVYSKIFLEIIIIIIY